MNRYPLWKYLVIAAVTVIGIVYALPNLYGKDPAVLVSPLRAQQVDRQTRDRIEGLLDQAGLAPRAVEWVEGKLQLRFADTEAQLKAATILQPELEGRFVVAQNLAPATPAWLRAIHAQPMYLGLDLQGGIHFLMEVDMAAALKKEYERYIGDIKTTLREARIRHQGMGQDAQGIRIRFKDAATRDAASERIHKRYRELILETDDSEGQYLLRASLGEAQRKEVEKAAVDQNITTLRNRVNELGVAEPVIQRQGESRIVVQLPGVQDPARAKEILGATATLEFHLADPANRNIESVLSSGRLPPGTRLYRTRDGRPVLLQRRVILTGDSIVHAASGIDTSRGAHSPAVFITLDSKGAKRFSDFTREHVGEDLAVVYIETKIETRMVDGRPVREKRRIEEVISVAQILDRLGKRFQITGLDSTEEARNLAQLLRAGALAAPVEIVEERTIGPSLGKDNIEQGFDSVRVGFLIVLVFMAVYYRVFGLVADLALGLNLVLIVALLSMLQATLTLPGIAGIVLTVGMAVDANVLIFERIREELRLGSTPQASIAAGYAKALSTIADANITTLIAALVLFGFGTGPIKGFAVTLSLGIITSMFTAIMGTRAVINLVYGRRRVSRLAI